MKGGQVFLIYLILFLFVLITNVNAFSQSKYYLTTNATSFNSILSGALKDKMNYKIEFKNNYLKREHELNLFVSINLDFLSIGSINNDKRLKPLFKKLVKFDEIALNKRVTSEPTPFSLLNKEPLGSFFNLYNNQFVELILFTQMPQQTKESFVVGSFVTTKTKRGNLDAAFAFFDTTQFESTQFLIDTPFINSGTISYFDLTFDDIKISKLTLKLRLFTKFIYENSFSLNNSSLFKVNLLYKNIDFEIEKYSGSIEDASIEYSNNEKHLNSLRAIIGYDFNNFKIEFSYFDFLYKKPIYAGKSQKREIHIGQSFVYQNRIFSCSIESSYQQKWSANGNVNGVYRFYLMGETKIKRLSVNLATALKYDKKFAHRSSISLKFPLNEKITTHVFVEMQDTLIKLRLTMLLNLGKESFNLVLNENYNNQVKYSTSL